jgi:protein TonB
MSATINAFPAVHTFNSPRSWVLAIIALLHLGFFWLLTSGLSKSFTVFPPPTSEYVVTEAPQPPPERAPPVDYKIARKDFVLHVPEPRVAPLEADAAYEFRFVTTDPVMPDPHAGAVEPVPQQPVEIEPMIDPRRGLSEPTYPSSAIRENVEGTVVLSVQVLENGRVGAVRIDTSSGDRRLDEAAVREARHWRLLPGTRDGVPVVLWKQVPITFQLKDVRL